MKKYTIYMRFRRSKKDTWTKWCCCALHDRDGFYRVGTLKNALIFEDKSAAQVFLNLYGNNHPRRSRWEDFEIREVNI